jgi:hypothetical protein
MSRVAAFVLLCTLSLAACSGDGSDATAGPPEVISIDQLNAAVRPAAQAVLDAPAVQVTTLWFDPDGEHIRTDWLDHREDNTYIHREDNTYMLVGQAFGPTDDDVDEMAWIQLADTRFCASSGADLYCDIEDPQTDEPWAPQEAPGVPENMTQLPISLDLEGMARDGTSVEGFGADQIKTTLQPGLDGGIVWTVETPSDDGAFTRGWKIDADGVLLSYTVGSDGGAPFGLYSRSQFEFLILADPAPILPPAVDTPLDLDALGLPPGLPLLGR